MPAVLLLTWQVPQQRRLVLTAAVLFVAMRVWTYLYFVPQISDWSQGTTPLTPVQLDQARTWVGLSWIRVAVDIAAGCCTTPLARSFWSWTGIRCTAPRPWSSLRGRPAGGCGFFCRGPRRS